MFSAAKRTGPVGKSAPGDGEDGADLAGDEFDLGLADRGAGRAGDGLALVQRELDDAAVRRAQALDAAADAGLEHRRERGVADRRADGGEGALGIGAVEGEAAAGRRTLVLLVGEEAARVDGPAIGASAALDRLHPGAPGAAQAQRDAGGGERLVGGVVVDGDEIPRPCLFGAHPGDGGAPAQAVEPGLVERDLQLGLDHCAPQRPLRRSHRQLGFGDDFMYPRIVGTLRLPGIEWPHADWKSWSSRADLVAAPSDFLPPCRGHGHRRCRRDRSARVKNCSVALQVERVPDGTPA